MSTAEILSLISTIAFVIAGISFVLAVVFWFVFKIPSVIGDLSGRTARKSIAQMREKNEKTGNKAYKPSKTNETRGKLTEPIVDEKKKKTLLSKKDDRPETGIFADNMANSSAPTDSTILLEDEATGLLGNNTATTLLDELTAPLPKRTGGKVLDLLDEVMLIHTDVVI